MKARHENTGKPFSAIQLQLSAFPFQTSNAQACVVCLQFFRATWLWIFILCLVLHIFQSDDHGEVAENIDSTWESEIGSSVKEVHWLKSWCLQVKKKIVFGYSEAKISIHKNSSQECHEKMQKRRDELAKGVTERGLYQLPFWNLISKTRFPNTLSQGLPRSRLEARDWSWG